MTLMDSFMADTPICYRGKIVMAVIVVVLLLLAYDHARALGDIDAGLYGFWEIDADFADKAHIDSMYIHIAPPGGRATNDIGIFGATCAMYIVIKADGAITFNERIPVAIRRTTMRLGGLYHYVVNFGKSVTCIPAKVSAEYDPSAAMLTLSATKTAYARLFKRPELSYYCAIDGATVQEKEEEGSDGGSDSDTAATDDAADPNTAPA